MLSLLTLAVIAAAAAVIYMMSAFRIGVNAPNTPHTIASSQPATVSPVDQAAPLPPPAHCAVIVKIAPRSCAAWSSPAGRP